MNLLRLRSWLWSASCAYILFICQPIWAVSCYKVFTENKTNTNINQDDQLKPSWKDHPFIAELVKEGVITAFELRPDYSGKTPIPLELTMSTSITSIKDKRTVEFEFTHQSMKNLPRMERLFVEELKVDSVSELKSREMGGVIFYYSDGTYKKVKYTSNDLTEVNNKAFDLAVNESGALDPSDGIRIEKVLHIHTHPDPEVVDVVTIQPSDGDALFYLGYKTTLKNALGYLPKFEAMIVPTCSNCVNLLFQLSESQIYNIKVFKTITATTTGTVVILY